MSIFKKERKPLYEEKTCSCPICGNIVKYRAYDFDQINYYMDGRPKMKFIDYIKQYGVCERCGYVFIPNYFRNENVILEGKIRDFVFSQEFEQIRKSKTLKEEEKFLLSIEFLENKPGNQATIMMPELYKLWYYEETETKEFVDKYRKYVANLLVNKYTWLQHGTTLFPKQLFFGKKIHQKRIHIATNEMLIDFYRQIGDFDTAQKMLNHLFEHYNFKSTQSPLLSYLQKEEELIKNKINDKL